MLQPAHAQQPQVVTVFQRYFRFTTGLVRRSANPGNLYKRPLQLRRTNFFRCQPKYRLVKVDPWLSDLELCRMHADSHAACTGFDVVSAKTPLPVFVQAKGCM